MTKIQILESQIKDWRIKYSNLISAKEQSEERLKEEITSLSVESVKKDRVISSLYDTIAKIDRKVDALEDTIKTLSKENGELKEVVARQSDQIEKLKSQINKDSSNSGKPPSSDGFRKPKPQSLREKSGRKPGGQVGHAGHGLDLFEHPTDIIEKKVLICDECGHEIVNSPDYTAKQKVDIEVSLSIKEERVFKGFCPCCGKKVQGQFSDGYINPVHYGDNLKTLVTLLNAHGCVSVNKTAEIINSISGGKLNISDATVVNIQSELSDKLTATVDFIRKKLIEGNVLNADETGCRVNGKLNWIQVLSNERFALFGLNEKRGDLDGDMDILSCFVGILVHDHFMRYYKNTLVTHAECNEHILRYLKSLIEIFKHEWANNMFEFLRRACHAKNELVAAGQKAMDNGEIDRLSKEYDSILGKGWAEYKAVTEGKKRKEAHYVDERRLLTRLGEYKAEHLRFITDFRAPFTNNRAEQDGRKFKNKCKVAGCFRSKEGANDFARIASLITTLKKQGMNVYHGISTVFSGCMPLSG